jgi:hypothetical protein
VEIFPYKLKSQRDSKRRLRLISQQKICQLNKNSSQSVVEATKNVFFSVPFIPNVFREFIFKDLHENNRSRRSKEDILKIATVKETIFFKNHNFLSIPEKQF